MPNHTDVRAFFFGAPDNIRALNHSCREHELNPAHAISLWDADSQTMRWPTMARFNIHGHPRPRTHVFGAIPSCGSKAPFSLGVGRAMPASMLVEESNMAEQAQAVISGHWREAARYPQFSGIGSCHSREEAIAWMRVNRPDDLLQGQRRVDNLAQHGASGWYDWSIKNWGTKWDCYCTSWGVPTAGGRMVEARMQTAWSPPLAGLSEICKKFGLGCSCAYIDEGGGFSAFTLIDALGASSHEQHQNGQRALFALARKAALDALGSMGEAPSKAKRAGSGSWVAQMAAGKAFTDKSFAHPAPAPESAEAGSAILAALDPDRQDFDYLIGAMDELARRGVASAKTPLLSGGVLGMALAHAGWLPGLDWAWKTSEPGMKPLIAALALSSGLGANDPRSARWGWDHLVPEARPHARSEGLVTAVESSLAIALSPETTPAMRSELLQQAQLTAQQWRADDDRLGALQTSMAAVRALSERLSMESEVAPGSVLEASRVRM